MELWLTEQVNKLDFWAGYLKVLNQEFWDHDVAFHEYILWFVGMKHLKSVSIKRFRYPKKEIYKRMNTSAESIDILGTLGMFASCFAEGHCHYFHRWPFFNPLFLLVVTNPPLSHAYSCKTRTTFLILQC